MITIEGNLALKNVPRSQWKVGIKKITEGIELPNQESIRTFGEKGDYKYVGILEMDTIKQAEMKEK